MQTDQAGRPPGKFCRPAWTQRKWGYEVGYAALVAVAVVLILSPVLRHSGWPLNQGTTAPLLLVQMYAAHFRHFDFLPVWSSSDGIGMGSPVLLYYHRAFFYTAGLIYALFGGLKASVIATIAIFLVVGAYGMRLALTVVTNSRLLCAAGSVGFLFTNYVFTDWLDPRGDLAEFSALMIVPWLLYWCLRLVKYQRFSFLLIPVMVVLVNAHTGIALISSFTLAIAFITFAAAAGLGGVRKIALRLVVSVVGVTVLLAPTLLAELRFSQFYDPQTKNVLFFKVSQQFVSFTKYFYDGAHQWFSPNQSPPHFNFVQIDFAITVPITVAMTATVVYLVTTKGRRDRWATLFARFDVPVLVFLVATFAVYLFLQLPISYEVYRLITPLQVINFSWRMLAFITPIGIILVVVIADGLMRRYPKRAIWGSLVALWVASLVVLSPITSSVPNFYVNLFGEHQLLAPAGQFPPLSLFTAPKEIDYPKFNGFVIAPPYFNGGLYNVFLPKVFTTNGHEVDYVNSLSAQLHRHQAGAQSLSQVACTVVGPSRAPFETLKLSFSVSCRAATRLALPISYNAYSKVFVERADGKLIQIPYFHLRTDPRIIISVTSSQPETVVVHLPTLWGILF